MLEIILATLVATMLGLMGIAIGAYLFSAKKEGMSSENKKVLEKIQTEIAEIDRQYHSKLKAATSKQEREEAYNWYMGEIDEILEREGL